MSALSNLVRNAKIRTKLLFGFGVIILGSIIINIVSTNALKTMNSEYTYLLNGAIERDLNMILFRKDFTTWKQITSNIIIQDHTPNQIASFENESTELLKSMEAYLQIFENSLINDPYVDISYRDASLNRLDNLRSLINDINNNYIMPVFNLAKQHNFNFAQAKNLLDSSSNTIVEINEIIDNSTDISNTTRINRTNNISEELEQSMIIINGLSILVILLCIVIALYNSNTITKGLLKVTNAAKKIAVGDFNVEVGSNYTDEIGQMSNSLRDVKITIERLINDLEQMAIDFSEGDIDIQLNESSYSGKFKSVAVSIDSIIHSSTSDNLYTLEVVSEFGKGHFDLDIKKLPGKKALLTESLENVKANLKQITFEISDIARKASQGDLNVHIASDKYEGDWHTMSDGINDLIASIVGPVREVISVLNEMSTGNLSPRIHGDYKGEFDDMKQALNLTMETISVYIDEISNVLLQLSQQDLTVHIDRYYIGDFFPIKKSINLIIENFITILTDINSSANSLATDSGLIANFTNKFAHSSTEQSESVKLLNTSITNLTTLIKEDVINIDTINTSILEAKDHIISGSGEVKDMLSAMNDINEASQNISKIIKVIDDIAFQTNILALNASVEAARAGQYGKGFAVVAEEVRSLATRSKEAANETSVLIESSIVKVTEGSKLAHQTNDSFKTIVDEIGSISDSISHINESFENQFTLISEVDSNIGKLSESVSENTATSQEQAAQAEELANQATSFKTLVSKFKLQ